VRLKLGHVLRVFRQIDQELLGVEQAKAAGLLDGRQGLGRAARVGRSYVELAEVVAQSFPVGFEHGLEASH